jgi:hypothetical protein
MATFKEAFAAARKEKGAGKTFMHNGKSYSTDYAEEAKGKKPKAKPAPTKPKARPANLNPQSGAAQSGTAGKVKPAATPAMSGASRSTAGKVKSKTSTAQQKAAYGANRPTSMDGVSRKPVEKPKPKTTTKDTSFAPLKRLGSFLAGGGMSGADKRKKAAEKAAKERR